MDDTISRIIDREGDVFSYALKTQKQKYAFLMSEGMKLDDARFAHWRQIELAFYRFLYAADKRRKDILADRLSDRGTSESPGTGRS